MIINHNTTTSTYLETIASLHGENIENVKEFPYLGYTIKLDEAKTGDTEIDLRIDLAESKFYEMRRALMIRKFCYIQEFKS